MNDFQFNLLVDDNIKLLISIVAGVCLVYWMLVRRFSVGFLDPITLGFFASSMASVVVIFLYATRQVGDNILYIYLAVELSFLFGFWLLAKKFCVNSVQQISGQGLYVQYRVATYVIYFSIQIALYGLMGLPILNTESRLEAFRDIRLIGWMLDGAQFNTIICVALALASRNISSGAVRWLDKFMFVFCLFALLVKGGKSDFILLFFMLFVAAKQLNNAKLARQVGRSVPLIGIALLTVTQLIISIWGVDISALELVLRRLLAFGDVYYLGLTPEVSGYFDNGKIFSRLFPSLADLLSGFGLLSKEFVGQNPIGYVLYEHYYGVERGAGPNPRMTYILLIGLGYAGILFSFAYGMLIAWLRFGLWKGRKSCSGIHYSLLMTLCCFFSFIDPALFLVYLVKATLFFLVVYGVIKFIRVFVMAGGSSGSKSMVLIVK